MAPSPDPDALLLHTPSYGACDAMHCEPNVEYVVRSLSELHDETYQLAGDLLPVRVAISDAIQAITRDVKKPMAYHRRDGQYLCDACALAHDRKAAVAA